MGFVAKGFEPDVNKKNNILHCFAFDHLSAKEGIAMLVGLIPEHAEIAHNWGEDPDIDICILKIGIVLLNGDEISCYPKSDDEELTDREACPADEAEEYLDKAYDRFTTFANKHSQLLQYWKSGKHPECTPPAYFIKWALSKNFRPAWLEQAIELGLYATNSFGNGPDTTHSADVEPDHEATLAALFNSVPVEALEKMFSAGDKWKTWVDKAASNGLKDAREGRARFNPYKAALWFVNKGMDGWDLARCYRALTNNLPARSLDDKHLLTGGID